MRLPDFIIIGAPKAGTTSLCRAFATNEEVHVIREKEALFFDKYYDRGTEWYADKFSNIPVERMAGEATPTYALGTNCHETAERIVNLIPTVKLIYCVREPIARIESHYLQDISNGIHTTSISDAINERSYLLETSRYHHVLTSYLRYFPQQQIHIVFIEELIANPEKIINECYRFLGVAETQEVSLQKLGAREDMQRYPQFLKNLRRSEQLDWLRDQLPKPLRIALRKRLSTPLTAEEKKIEWSPEVLKTVKEILSPDARSFLSAMNKDPKIWGL